MKYYKITKLQSDTDGDSHRGATTKGREEMGSKTGDAWFENGTTTANVDDVKALDNVLKKTKRKSEASLETYFKEQVKANGGTAEKWRAIDRWGVPDRVVFSKHGPLFVELKADDGKVSAKQKVLHDFLWNTYGILVYVPFGKEGVDKWIETVLKAETPLRYSHPAHIKK